MRKFLFSFVMLMAAVLSASAFTIYVPNDYTGKEGETFVSYKYFTSGNTDQLQYTVTYVVNTAATGTDKTQAALVTIRDIVFEGNLKNSIKDFEFPAFFAIEKRDGTKMGYGRVSVIGGYNGTGNKEGELFAKNTVVETITLNFYDNLVYSFGVGPYAFEGCSNLKRIYVKQDGGSPHRPTFDQVMQYAFYQTPAYTDTVKLSTKDVFAIGGYAFYHSGITAVEAKYGPQTNLIIAFCECPNLTSFTFGGGSKNGSGIVDRCPKLSKVVWTGSAVEEYETASNSPFNKVRDQITSLTIRGDVPAHTFEGFNNVLMIQSPADLGTHTITIGARAFADCKNLLTAAVGGNMDQSAFEGCEKLKSITWRGGFSWGTETPSASKSPLHSVGVQLKRIYFQGTNTSIPDYLCAGMKQLEYVGINNLPNGQVGAHAFENCPKLTTVDFSDEDGEMITNGNQYWIFENAFAGCKALSEVVNLPVITWQIGDKAFYNCTALKDCPITQKHTSLRQLGSEVFAGSGITSLVVPVGVTGTGSLLVNDCPNVEEIYFLPNVTSAKDFGGSWAELFAKADSKTREAIHSIYLNNQLTQIPEEMFMGYTGLVNQYAVIPSETNPRYLATMNKVSIIYSKAFQNCTSLENCAALKSSALTQIYPAAFENSNIKTTFAEMGNLTTIWNDAFKNCPNIVRFGAEKIDGAETILPKLNIINANAFEGCANLKSVHLPANLKTIGTDAFANCPVETVLFGIANAPTNMRDPLGSIAGMDKTQVKTLVIGDNVTYIPAYLAQEMTLKSLKIGYNVKGIGAEAFADCAQLEEVTINTNLENMSTNWNELNPETAPFVRSAVRKVSFGPAATAAGRCILAGTDKLNELSLNNVVDFKEYAFAGTGLEEITLTNAGTISGNAFKNAALKTINLMGTAPASVSSSAFDGCSVATINASCTCYGEVAGNSTWKAVCANIKNAESFVYPDMNNYFASQGKMNITSPLDCDGKFTVEAVPAEGFSFISWVDGNKENPRTVDMNEYTMSALYPLFDNPSLYTEEIKLNITPENAGVVRVFNEDNAEEVINGKFKRDARFVFIPQLPDAANWYEFSRWEYDESKSAVPYAADDAYYPNGLSVNILFTPGGENDGETPEFPEEITAVFEPKDIAVEVRSCTDGHGTIKIEGEAKLGSTVTLTAVPDKGYAFQQWGSDEKATKASVEVTLTLDKILKAGVNPEDAGTPVLDPNTKTLLPYEESALYYVELCANFVEASNKKVTITATGNHCTVEGAGEYKYGEEVMLTVYTEPHYNFTKWSDGNIDNPRIFTATEDLNLTAICEADSFDITLQYDPQVVEIEGKLRYAYGDETNLTAKLKDPVHYTFEGWFMDKTYDDALTLKVVVTKNMNIDVRVKANRYMISTAAEPAEGGTVLGAGEWGYNEKIGLIAQPAEGYEFVGWKDDATAPAQREVIVQGEATYTAIFRLIGDGIEEVLNDTSSNRKVMVDGVIYIIRDGKIFSVLGQKVN